MPAEIGSLQKELMLMCEELEGYIASVKERLISLGGTPTVETITSEPNENEPDTFRKLNIDEYKDALTLMAWLIQLQLGIKAVDRAKQREFLQKYFDREITSAKDITHDEARLLIRDLRHQPDELAVIARKPRGAK